jgi:hypothetical protein
MWPLFYHSHTCSPDGRSLPMLPQNGAQSWLGFRFLSSFPHSHCSARQPPISPLVVSLASGWTLTLVIDGAKPHEALQLGLPLNPLIEVGPLGVAA